MRDGACITHIAEKDPHVLEKRAYLTPVEAVYEQLMTGKFGLRNEDLVALPKPLAEHRRDSAREPLRGRAKRRRRIQNNPGGTSPIGCAKCTGQLAVGSLR
jgi:hypothetical protein